MRAERGEKGRGKRREKKSIKEEKMGIKIVFFFFFFISPCACFFICAVVIFQTYKENCI